MCIRDRCKTRPHPPNTVLLSEKVAQMPLFNLIFLGLGWPSVGEYDGFVLIFMYVSQPNGIWCNTLLLSIRDGVVAVEMG